jgi:hypothetical protein
LDVIGRAGLSAEQGHGHMAFDFAKQSSMQKIPNFVDIRRSSKKDELLMTPCRLLLSRMSFLSSHCRLRYMSFPPIVAS